MLDLLATSLNFTLKWFLRSNIFVQHFAAQTHKARIAG